jgi:hypothetical protein
MSLKSNKFYFYLLNGPQLSRLFIGLLPEFLEKKQNTRAEVGRQIIWSQHAHYQTWTLSQ